MKSIFLLLLLVGTAMAQRTVWTWTPPPLPGDRSASAVLSSGIDAKGNAAVVIGEYWEDTTANTYGRQFRLLWVSSKGAILHNETFPSNFEIQHILGAASPLPTMKRWQVLSVSAKGCTITDGTSIWSGTVKGKAATLSKVQTGDEIIQTDAVWRSTFQGYLKRTGGYSWNYYYWPDLQSTNIEAFAHNMQSLSLVAAP